MYVYTLLRICLSAGKGIHLSSRSARKWHFIWSRNNLQLLARWVFTYALWPRDTQKVQTGHKGTGNDDNDYATLLQLHYK